MKKRSPRFDAFLSILLLLGLVVLIYSMLYGGPLPLTQQMRNLRAAEAHVPALQPRLNEDARYTHLKAGVWPGEGGCLSIHGVPSSDSDFGDLKKLVEARKPPVGILYLFERPTGEHFGGWQPMQ